jgi:hypothetical protein
MTTFLISMLAIIGGLLLFFVVVRFILTVLLPKAPSEGEGYISAEENAYIISVNHTGITINNYPVLDVEIAIFPQEGPMLSVKTRSSFTYAEIPYLRANEPVRMSYRFNAELAQSEKDDAVLDIKILGPAQVLWEGDSTVKDAVNLLLSRIEGSKLIDAQGEILNIERTNAVLGGNPVFRYEVRFRTNDGQWVEGETYQAARPWLERQRYRGSTEDVQYSATDYSDFILAKR